MKYLGICSLLILLLIVNAKPSSQISAEAELSSAAKDFFTALLLDRNSQAAMKYVSANPILGSCMTPDYLNKKRKGIMPLTNPHIRISQTNERRG